MKRKFCLLLSLLFFSVAFSQSQEGTNNIVKLNCEHLEQELVQDWQTDVETVKAFMKHEEDYIFGFILKNQKYIHNTEDLKTQMASLKKDLALRFSKFEIQKETYQHTSPAPMEVNGPCNNIDFENGTRSGWQGHTARACSTALVPCNQTAGFSNSRHLITNTALTDPFIPTLSTVAPGGSYSMRLEDLASGRDVGLNAAGNASLVRQTFLVGPTNNLFTYQYAAVLEDPGDHQDAERPYFKVRMYDAAGDEIDCASYTVIAKPPLQSFSHVQVENPNRNGNDAEMDLYYRPWTTVSIPLTAYMGQNVTVVFMASDCSRGGHMAYAYVDAKCAAIKPPQDTTICGDTPKNLTAPDGFQAYAWTGPGIIGSRTGQTISVNRPGNYVVRLTPFSDDPCPISMTYTVVQVCPTDPIKDTLCETIKGSGQTRGVDLTTYNPAVIDGRSGVTVRGWYKDKVQANNLLNPATQVTVANAQKFYAVTSFPDTVALSFLIISKPNITIPAIPPACEGSAAFQISGVLPAGGTFKGPYITTTGSFNPSTEGTHTFTYIFTNASGCTDSSSQTVKVVKPATISTTPVNPHCATATSINISGTSNLTTAVSWSGGAGTFQNPNSAQTTYTPTAAEKNSGSPVVLTLKGIAQSPCPAVQATLNLSFVLSPTVTITDIDKLCADVDSIQLSGTTTQSPSLQWSGGSGSFKDITKAQTVYYPTTTEKNSTTTLSLTLKANANTPCVATEDQVSLNFIKLAAVTIPTIPEICNATDSVLVKASSQNTVSTQWTGGSGSFKDAGSLNTYYYPSTSEKSLANPIVLTVKGLAGTPCPAVTQTQTLTIIKAPTVSAQDLPIVCNIVDSIAFNGTSTNNSSISWSGGTGTFENSNTLTTSYKPSISEKTATTPIIFTLTAQGQSPCPNATDTISLRIVPKPELILSEVSPICASDVSFNIQWTENYAQALVWNTKGGVLVTHTGQKATYTPLASEKTDSSIFLSVEALGYSPCPSVKDSIEITVIQAPTVEVLPVADICASTDSIPLKATHTHTKTLSWQGGQGGNFAQKDSAATLYILSAADKSSNSLQFYLIGAAELPCKAAKDSIKVNIVPLPKIAANELNKFCEDVDTIAVKVSGENLSSISWSGSGTFKHPNQAATSYQPTQAEKEAGIGILRVVGQAAAPCGSVHDSVKLLFVPLPQIAIVPINAICADIKQINLSSISENTEGIQWYGGKGKFSTGNQSQTSYQLHADEQATQQLIFRVVGLPQAPCKAAQDTALLRIHPLPLGGHSSVTFCNDNDASIRIDAGAASQYQWISRPDTSRYISITEANRYEVAVKNEFGCATTRSIEVLTECPPRLFISNAFSPNKDGTNDKYTVYGVHIGAFHMLIFNRWGEIIFESKNMYDVWDGDYRGEPMPIGVYEWVITYEGDSEKYRGPYQMKGSVTVVR